MSEAHAGRRLGPFVVFQDEEGCRHAIRQSCILAISEVDGAGGHTLVTMTSNRSATVRRPFDEVIAWFW